MLQRDGVIVTDLRLGGAPVDANEVMTRFAAKNVGREEVIAFTSQIAIMLDTGVPLADALKAYTEQSRSVHTRRVVGVVSSRVTAGVSFSESLAEFPGVFPPIVVNLMRAAEASGTLAPMLTRVSQYMAQERRTARQIKGALMYPAAMVSLAVVVTGFLVIWVLPRFAKIYQSREAALPAPTRIVLGASEFIAANGAGIVATLIALTIGGFLFLRSATGRRTLDRVRIGAPVIGKIFSKLYLVRSTRTLGTLLAAGVTLLEAIRIVRGVTQNLLWQELWDKVEQAMTSGKTVSSVVAVSGLIPASAAQMIAAGERTGRLPEVLEKIAHSADDELDETIRVATQLIEPAMIVFMGVTIGGLALALLLPIFSISNVLSG
jgi:type IV pilus assembly protein PilC